MSIQEEIYEIFARLFVKPLLRLSTASKDLHSFLFENYFQEKQCKKSLNNESDSLIIQEAAWARGMETNLWFCFLPEGLPYSAIPSESMMWLDSHCVCLLSSINGVVVGITDIDDGLPKMFMCDPAMKTFTYIEWHGEQKVAHELFYYESAQASLVCGYSFGMELNDHPYDYTLLLFTHHDGDESVSDGWGTGYDVHILKEGKFILKRSNFVTRGRSVLLEEMLPCRDGVYLISDGGDYLAENSSSYFPYIIRYDVENGTNVTIGFPVEVRETFNSYWPFRIFGWDRNLGNSFYESICLASYRNDFLSIWLLTSSVEEQADQYSWRELINVNVFQTCDHLEWTNIFTIGDKSLIFLSKRENFIYRYVLKGKRRGHLEQLSLSRRKSNWAHRFYLYSTTIRPCAI